MKLTLLSSLLLTIGSLEAASYNKVPSSATCLYQSDFETGTKIITAPGQYKLCEDIVFHPNGPSPGETPADDAFDPIFPGDYDENAFGLGFFAAIAIAASDVELYLNGFTIEQSEGHALFQRFFSIIELADSPFIKNAGPAQFVGEEDYFQAASNVVIAGPGVLGRSSHHGIHGNDNVNVIIENIHFVDFEVAAVSLNNVRSLIIEDCYMERNRQDIPVLGMFSAARFLRPYAKKLVDLGYEMDIRGQSTTAAALYDSLIQTINNVYEDVVNSGNGVIDQDAHPMEYELFHNSYRVVDGPCYAIVVHGKGPAVGAQGQFFDEMGLETSTVSQDVTIRNNIINNIVCSTNEIPAAVENGLVVNDARGSIFQFVSSRGDFHGISINADGTYKGNVIADLQVMVAKAIHEGVLQNTPLAQTIINTIPPSMVEWASSSSSTYSPMYRCNGDSMHHVNKGIVVIRVEETKGFDIFKNTISGVRNLSPEPFPHCSSFHTGASYENFGEQQSGNVRAISAAAVRGYVKGFYSSIKLNNIFDVDSLNANVVVGIDVQGDSQRVEIKSNEVDLKSEVGEDPSDEYLALRVRENVDGSSMFIIQSNKFVQEQQILSNRRNLRSELPKDAHHRNLQEVDLKNGGCPFSRNIK